MTKSVTSLMRAGAALLILMCAQPGTAQIEDQPDDRSQILSAVKKAASICRTAPPARAEHGESADQSQYLGAINAVLKRGRAAVPVLRRLASSKDVDPFEARLTMILVRRIEHPEQFEKVARYLIPDSEDPLRRLIPKGTRSVVAASRGPKGVPELRTIDLELMHPDVRRTVKKYPRIHQQFTAAVQQLLTDAVQKAQGDFQARRALETVLQNRVARIMKKNDIPRRAARVLMGTTGLLTLDRPKLDPEYLLAWEEIMVRPAAWEMRRKYVKIVMSFSELASTPSLGHIVREAVEHNRMDMLYAVLDPLMQREPNEAVLRELSGAIRHADGKSKALLQRNIGGRVSALKPWETFLSGLELKVEFKADVDCLRGAVKVYQQARDAAGTSTKPQR
jgi:hypothetical protein